MAHRLPARTRWLTGLALLLPALLLWACTTEPLSAVDDFEFDFDFPEPDLGTEVDTSTVQVVYEDIEDDTAYVAQQNNVSAEVEQASAPPESVNQTAQAATEAIDDADEEEVADIAQEADDDLDAATSALQGALEDPNSPQSQLANRVTDAAAQQAELANLLGLQSSSGKASAMGDRPVVLPAPEITFDVTGVLDTQTCQGDAQAQFQTRLNALTQQRDQVLAALERAFQRSTAGIEATRADLIVTVAQANRARRIADAQAVFLRFRNAINRFVANGQMTDAQARQWRVLNGLIFISNMRYAVLRYRLRLATINANADAALQVAQQQRTTQFTAVTNGFNAALQTLQARLQAALRRCHDQGQTTG